MVDSDTSEDEADFNEETTEEQSEGDQEEEEEDEGGNMKVSSSDRTPRGQSRSRWSEADGELHMTDKEEESPPGHAVEEIKSIDRRESIELTSNYTKEKIHAKKTNEKTGISNDSSNDKPVWEMSDDENDGRWESTAIGISRIRQQKESSVAAVGEKDNANSRKRKLLKVGRSLNNQAENNASASDDDMNLLSESSDGEREFDAIKKSRKQVLATGSRILLADDSDED